MEFRKTFVEAVAFIDGHSLPVTRLALNFELNGIPNGEIGLPFGRLIQTGQPSAIGAFLAALKSRTKIQLFIRARGAQTGVVPKYMPNGIYRLFDGFVDTANIRRNPNATEFTVGINHALVGMHDSSALSGNSHVGNPLQFYSGAGVYNSASGIETVMPVGQAANYITAANLNEDVWGKALYPWFQSITREDRLRILSGNAQINKPTKKNDGAAAALKLLSPEIIKTMKAGLENFDDVTLAFSLSKWLNENVRRVDSFARQTMWDVLIGDVLSPLFMAVVPFSWGGYVRPFVPGIRTALISIDDEDITDLTIVRHFPRQVEAIGLLGSFASYGNMVGPGNITAYAKPEDNTGYSDVVGYYKNDEVSNGLQRLLNAPPWLSDASYTGFKDSVSVTDVIGAATNPLAAAVKVGANLVKFKSAQTKHARTMDNLARCIYLTEVLQQRQMLVRGPLRFDLSPGTRVKISVNPSKFTGTNSLSSDKIALMMGTVLRVSIGVSTNPDEYNTILHLGHVSTVAEAERDAYGTDEHPLFNDYFVGAPIAEKYGSPREKQYPIITGSDDVNDDVIKKTFNVDIKSGKKEESEDVVKQAVPQSLLSEFDVV